MDHKISRTMIRFGKYLFLSVLSGTWSLTTAQTANVIAAQAMAQAQAAIENLVRADARLTPEFLRMGFHDCVGGCDGCIDLSNPDNNGLARPISVLDPIVQQFATAATGLSRPDIWALAVTVAADVAEHGFADPIRFTQTWFGRVSCENANSICRNANGQVVPCSATAGPHRVLPSPKLDSNGVFSYFANNFGFNERQTITIMGAHTVGRLVKSELGIDGPHGWTVDNVSLQNEFYIALVTTATAATPDSQKADLAPEWRRFFEDNSGTSFPSLHRWQLVLEGLGKNLTMLNSDIALVRDLNSGNTNPTTGQVSCAFNSPTGSPVCPIRPSGINIAARFSDDNNLWLREFKVVLDLMLTNGYNRVACTSSVCRLTSNRPPVSPIAPFQTPTVAVTGPPTKAPISSPTIAKTRLPSNVLSTSAPIAPTVPKCSISVSVSSCFYGGTSYYCSQYYYYLNSGNCANPWFRLAYSIANTGVTVCTIDSVLGRTNTDLSPTLSPKVLQPGEAVLLAESIGQNVCGGATISYPVNVTAHASGSNVYYGRGSTSFNGSPTSASTYFSLTLPSYPTPSPILTHSPTKAPILKPTIPKCSISVSVSSCFYGGTSYYCNQYIYYLNSGNCANPWFRLAYSIANTGVTVCNIDSVLGRTNTDLSPSISPKVLQPGEDVLVAESIGQNVCGGATISFPVNVTAHASGSNVYYGIGSTSFNGSPTSASTYFSLTFPSFPPSPTNGYYGN